MIVYQLDQDGYYLGSVTAEESPREPGVWLIPAGCIATPPPAAEAGTRPRWMDRAWALEAVPEAPEPSAPETPEPNPRILTRVQFLSRLTADEWQQAKTSNHAGVGYFVDLTLTAQEIDLDDPRTVAGIGVAVATGVLTEARAAEVLA
ncbi:hypothetical protein [Megalodesulfovibrio paquesii]